MPLFSRRKSDRTYSLTSYTGVGDLPPNRHLPNPAAVAAASNVGNISQPIHSSRLSSAAAATAIRRHSLTNDSLPAANAIARSASLTGSISGAPRRPSGRPVSAVPLQRPTSQTLPRPRNTTTTTTTSTTTTTGSHGRTMSLTTTTVRNLGSFQLISTKTVPLHTPPIRRSASTASGRSGNHHALSFESELNPVSEEDAENLLHTTDFFASPKPNPPRSAPARQLGRQSFAKVTNTPRTLTVPKEASVDPLTTTPIKHVKHVPPPRSVSPMKPALKDSSSLNSSSDGGAETTSTIKRKNTRVSFSGESDIEYIPSNGYREFLQPLQSPHAAAASVAARTHPLTGSQPNNRKVSNPAATAAAAKSSKNSSIGIAFNRHEDSDSGNSVYSDAFEDPIETEMRNANANANANAKAKAAVGKSLRSNAAIPPKKSLQESLRKKPKEVIQHQQLNHQIVERTQNAQSAQTRGRPVQAQHQVQQRKAQPQAQPQTQPVQNSHQHPHHYRALAVDSDNEEQHDEHNPEHNPEDDSDTISLNSDSSWKRDATPRVKSFKLSLRNISPPRGSSEYEDNDEENDNEYQNGWVEPAQTNDPANVPTPVSPNASARVSTRVPVRVAARVTARVPAHVSPHASAHSPSAPISAQPTPIVRKNSTGGFRTHSLRSNTPQPDFSAPQDQAQRTNSISSFEKEKRNARSSTKFARMSMRDHQPPLLKPTPIRPASNVQSPRQFAASSPTQPFRSRIADSDSDDDLGLSAVPLHSSIIEHHPQDLQLPQKKGKFMGVFSPSNSAKVLVGRNGVPPPPRPTKKPSKDYSYDHDLIKFNPDGTMVKKKKFPALRRVFRLDQ